MHQYSLTVDYSSPDQMRQSEMQKVSLVLVMYPCATDYSRVLDRDVSAMFLCYGHAVP